MTDVVDVILKNRKLIDSGRRQLEETECLSPRMDAAEIDAEIKQAAARKARVDALDADTLDGYHADEIIRLGRMGGGGSGGAGEAAAYVDVLVPANSDSVVVGHTLGKVPDAVLPEPQDDLGGRSFWVTGKTSTEFTFHISSPDSESGHAFRCRVW